MTESAEAIAEYNLSNAAAKPKRSRFWRWLMPREVLVFVSSPGDCGVERDLARRAIAKLNERPEIVRTGIRFRSLLWEDLPPGIAEDGDFQRRLYTLMRRYGYDTYGIYLGFMKGGLGTPTPRYRSGTIEELESSLEGSRRFGTPSEILFYFVLPNADEVEEVRLFRCELEQRGFLSARVTREDFYDRISDNLFEIAKSWNSLGNVLRRSWRRFGIAAFVTISLLATGLGAAEVISRQQIERALERGNVGRAAELWRDRKLVMPISGSTARRRVNEAAAKSIKAEGVLVEKLRRFAAWRSDPAFLADEFLATKESLKSVVQQTIEIGVLETPNPDSVNVWRLAYEAGIWSGDEAVAIRLLERLAEGRLLQALVSTGIPLEQWEGALLRPEEADALKAFARRVLSRVPDLAGWNDRRSRIALSLLAGDLAVLKRLATRAARTDSADQPELKAFLAAAPTEMAVNWLREIAAPNLKSHVVGRIVDQVRALGNPDLIITLVDLVASGRLAKVVDSFLEDLVCPLTPCAAPATQRLVAWAAGDAPLSEFGLDLLLPVLRSEGLKGDERARLDREIVKRAKRKDGFSPPKIGALSKLGQPDGLRLLSERVQQHVSDEISFGYRQREHLIDHLRRLKDSKQGLADARAILLRTEENARSLGETRYGRTMQNFPGVERAYLSMLADVASLATAQDHELLVRIVERMVADDRTSSFHRADREKALGRALLALPAKWRNALFNWKAPPLVDPPWEPIWNRRRLLLQALVAFGGPPPEKLAWTVFRSLPQDKTLADEFKDLATKLDPDAARAYFRSRLATQDWSALAELGRLGDAEGLSKHIGNRAAHLSDVSANPELGAVIEAVGALDPSRRRLPITELVSRVSGAAALLLSAAASSGVDLPVLRTAALDAIRQPKDAAALAGAIRYLANIAPSDFWPVLIDEQSIKILSDWLGNVVPFDWVIVAQEMIGPTSIRLPDAVARFVMLRRLLLVLENGAHLKRNLRSGWMALDGAQRATSHLLAAFAFQGEPASALKTLAAVAAASRQVETLGVLSDTETVFKAYTTWLAASPLRAHSAKCIPTALFGVEKLDDANALVVRAASALVLASPAAAAKGHCGSAF